MPMMLGMKPVQLKEAQHKRLKLLATMRGVSMGDLVKYALDLYEAQSTTELPHPDGSQSVPVIYTSKSK